MWCKLLGSDEAEDTDDLDDLAIFIFDPDTVTLDTAYIAARLNDSLFKEKAATVLDNICQASSTSLMSSGWYNLMASSRDGSGRA